MSYFIEWKLDKYCIILIFTAVSVFNILKSSHKIKDNYPAQGELNSKFSTQKGFHINIIEAINNVISKKISTLQELSSSQPKIQNFFLINGENYHSY